MPECCFCDRRCRSWDNLGRHLAEAHAADYPCVGGMQYDREIGSVRCFCGVWLWRDGRARRLGAGVVQTLGEHLEKCGGAARHLLLLTLVGK